MALVAFNVMFRTSNPERYAKRLFIWAVISQPLHMLIIAPWWAPNFFFVLACVAYVMPRIKQWTEHKDPVPRWFFYAFYPLHFLGLRLAWEIIN